MAWVHHGNGVYISSTEGDVLEGTYYIDWVEWCDTTGPAGDEFYLRDGAGNCIHHGVSERAPFQREYRIEGTYTNPTLTQLDAGNIMMKTKKHPYNI